METSEKNKLLATLEDRQDAVAKSWYEAIADTGFTAFTTMEVRQRLCELTARIIALLGEDSFEREEAREIGAALAELRYLSPEALGRTQEVLARRLVEDLPIDQFAVLQPLLMRVLSEIAVGFISCGRETVLKEQEDIRAALLRERSRTEDALRRSQASLAEAQRVAHVGHWELDLGRNALYWSDEIFRIFDVGKDEFGATLESFRDFVHPDDLEMVDRLGQEALQGKPGNFEHRILRPNGEIRIVNQRVEAISDDTGRPAKLVGTVQDVTERKRAEEELRKARDDFEERVEERTAELAQANRELRTQISRRERAEETQRFLSEASAVLASSLDYRGTLSDVARLAVPQLADWCTVDIMEDDTLNRVAVAHQNPAKLRWARELQERYPYDPNAPQGVPAVVRTGRAEFYQEISDEMLSAAARDPDHLKIMREVGFTSVIIVPLVARGRTLGAVTLVSAESGRHYGDEELELAEELARRAALAVDNARLYEEAKKEIVERRRAEEALRSSRNELEIVLLGVTDGITAQDPTGRLVYANEAAARIIGYPSVRALLEAPTQELMRSFEVSDESGRPFPLESLPGRSALRGERPPETMLRFHVLETGEERWSIVKASPVFDEWGRVLLAVNIFRDVTERRRIQERLREVREAERSRMARDLHDGPLQDLSYTLAEMQVVRRLSKDEALNERMSGAIEVLKRAGRTLGDAVYDLRQESVREQSFLRSVETLLELTRQMNPGYELELSVGSDFPENLSETVDRELLRIIQEALTNARRHSGADRVMVSLETAGEEVRIEISDNGRGFDPGSVASGVGLKSMRERAEILDGELLVESEPEKGTRVRLRTSVPGLPNTPKNGTPPERGAGNGAG